MDGEKPMTKGMYGQNDIRRDGLLKIKKLKERDQMVCGLCRGKGLHQGKLCVRCKGVGTVRARSVSA